MTDANHESRRGSSTRVVAAVALGVLGLSVTFDLVQHLQSVGHWDASATSMAFLLTAVALLAFGSAAGQRRIRGGWLVASLLAVAASGVVRFGFVDGPWYLM